MFRMLGALLAIYTVYAAMNGSVFAKQRWWGRHFHRSEEPKAFWVIVVIYAGLSVALLTVF